MRLIVSIIMNKGGSAMKEVIEAMTKEQWEGEYRVVVNNKIRSELKQKERESRINQFYNGLALFLWGIVIFLFTDNYMTFIMCILGIYLMFTKNTVMVYNNK